MKRFIEGEERGQRHALLPEHLDDYVGADNPVRFIDAFVDGLDLAALGFIGAVPKATGRPAYAPGGPAEAVHLRLSEPGPQAGGSSGNPPQHRGDLAADA